MFTSKKLLIKKSGRKGVDRPEYLEQLVSEFSSATSLAYKEQTLANLANFAYDPLNYPVLRSLRVIEIFLDQIDSKNHYLAEFALKGICNLCVDPVNQEIIFREGGIEKIKQQLESENEETLLAAITSLYYLITPFSQADIATSSVAKRLQELSQNPSKRIANIAKILLEKIS